MKNVLVLTPTSLVQEVLAILQNKALQVTLPRMDVELIHLLLDLPVISPSSLLCHTIAANFPTLCCRLIVTFKTPSCLSLSLRSACLTPSTLDSPSIRLYTITSVLSHRLSTHILSRYFEHISYQGSPITPIVPSVL